MTLNGHHHDAICHYIIFYIKNNDQRTLFSSKYDWMGRNNLKDSHGIAQKPRHIKIKQTSKTYDAKTLILLESAVFY